MVVLPSVLFSRFEGWSFVDAIYFSFISLTTIGFGDIIPSTDPPLSFAISRYNVNDCFIALVNPVGPYAIAQDNAIPAACEPSKFKGEIVTLYHFYHFCVFVWIVLGLAWLSGVIAILTSMMVCSRELKYGCSVQDRRQSESPFKSFKAYVCMFCVIYLARIYLILSISYCQYVIYCPYIVIFSYIVIYCQCIVTDCHILSRILIYGHILSYIVTYFHILSHIVIYRQYIVILSYIVIYCQCIFTDCHVFSYIAIYCQYIVILSISY